MDEDFYLYVQDDKLYCCDDTTMISVNDSVKTEKSIMSRIVLSEESLSLQKIDVLTANQNTNLGIALLANYESTLSSNYGMLNVPIVENEKLDGDYHCWAACVASQISYKKNLASTEALDAYDVHLAMKQTYPRSTYGKPEGSQLWIERAYSYYNTNMGSFNSGACYDQVKNLIQQNCPVFAALADSTMTYGHAVIVCGYQSAQGGYYYYTIMDPNEPSYVTVQTTSSATSRSFTIVSNNMTFTEWMYGYY